MGSPPSWFMGSPPPWFMGSPPSHCYSCLIRKYMTSIETADVMLHLISIILILFSDLLVIKISFHYVLFCHTHTHPSPQMMLLYSSLKCIIFLMQNKLHSMVKKYVYLDGNNSCAVLTFISISLNKYMYKI